MLTDDSDLQKKLQKMLSPKRFAHSKRVARFSVELALIHGVDEAKAHLAGLLHDCGRIYPIAEMISIAQSFGLPVDMYEHERPLLLHDRIGSVVAREQLGIHDEEILSAIACHTTGKGKMSQLDKIIYLADYAEPNRKFNGVKLVREACKNNLDKALLLATSQVIRHLISNKNEVHPRTLACRQYALGMLGNHK